METAVTAPMWREHGRKDGRKKALRTCSKALSGRVRGRAMSRPCLALRMALRNLSMAYEPTYTVSDLVDELRDWAHTREKSNKRRIRKNLPPLDTAILRDAIHYLTLRPVDDEAVRTVAVKTLSRRPWL